MSRLAGKLRTIIVIVSLLAVVCAGMVLYAKTRVAALKSIDEKAAAAKLDKAEKDAAEAKEQLQPRHLTNTQKAALLADLKSIDKDSLHLVTILGDREAALFAAELGDIFESAGWKRNDLGLGDTYGTHQEFAGLIFLMDKDKPTPFTENMIRIFHGNGIEITYSDAQAFGPGVALLVAHKP